MRAVKTGSAPMPEPAVGPNQWYHVGVGAPPILEPILVRVGMFTGGTIWILTHGQPVSGWHLHLSVYWPIVRLEDTGGPSPFSHV